MTMAAMMITKVTMWPADMVDLPVELQYCGVEEADARGQRLQFYTFQYEALQLVHDNQNQGMIIYFEQLVCWSIVWFVRRVDGNFVCWLVGCFFSTWRNLKMPNAAGACSFHTPPRTEVT